MIETVRNNTYMDMLLLLIAATIGLSILTTNISVNSAMTRGAHEVPFLRTPLRPYGAAHGQPIPPPGLLGTLEVTTKVLGGSNKPSDFTITVSGKGPSPGTFFGSSSGTPVTLKPGEYSVSASYLSGYTTTYSSGCSGSISGGKNIDLCTVTNQYTPTSAH